ncbi:hypothetical protein EST38_g8578 [Candolleomyces aberdarensis]|uniref:Uncharacterized protein n=1 Tax=Candolleomyces aberdarensis TaxID=2316362 RepID=A0A4Q2DFJ5_9AGAR|nr:hypothetical protein EST38_g8578 [Candolleomyces aberdarensis]
MNRENRNLTVLEVATKAPPALKPGDVDPELAQQFENACNNFFLEKGVKEEDQVKRVLNTSFHDNRMVHWVDCNRAALEAMKFCDFMGEFRSQWLDTHWSGHINSELHVMQQNKCPFREWYMDFYSKSLLLKGTPNEMSDKELRKFVYSLLNPHLKSCAKQDCFRSIVDLKAWSDAPPLEDRSIRTEAAFFRSTKGAEGHSISGNGASSNNSGCCNRNGAGSSADGRVKPPPLTADERNLLKNHDGCFICCEFYIGHKSGNCNGSYPDGTSYKELTVNDARTAATKRNKMFNLKAKFFLYNAKGKGKAVATATIEEVGVAALAGTLDYELDSDNLSPSTILVIDALILESLH